MSDPLQPCEPVPPPSPGVGYETTVFDVIDHFYSSGFLLVSAFVATLIVASVIAWLRYRKPSSPDLGYRGIPSPLRLTLFAAAILTAGIVAIFTCYDLVSNAVTEPRCPDWQGHFVFADWQSITTLTLAMAHAWAIACSAIVVWSFLRQRARVATQSPEQ